MATTVRIRDEDKASLDALQARFTLGLGVRLPLEEVLHRVIAFAEDHEDELVLSDEPVVLARKQKEAFFSGASDWGFATSEEEIDRVLYGGEGPP